jgi:hypothetical protein
MVTNASGERSFSKLKFIKNELRNRTTQPRLNSLSFMCIENDILENIDFNDIIHDFASRNVEKQLCNVVPVIGVPVLLVFLKCDGVTHYHLELSKM